MRLNSFETTKKQKAGAFTLIEMIGVLAVIAILAALLIPKVFSAINDARINSALVGCETIKTALVDHYGKYGRFDATNGVALTTFATAGNPYSGYDTNVLMIEGLIDKPFTTKVGTNSTIQVVTCAASGAAVLGTGNGAFNLSGNGGGNEATGQYVVQAVIFAMAEADAQAISQRIDGLTMSTAGVTPGTADVQGRVTYAQPSQPGNPVNVYIYLAHR
jgi:type II secretory pathway pseudopilin PulG